MPLLENFGISNPSKDRIVAKKGIEYYSIPINQISHFYSENKLTFLINTENQRYIVDYTLSDLEKILNHKEFFRINRQCITHVNAVRKFKSIDKGKIQLTLHPDSKNNFIISQENASSFKHWLGK
ncbi:MAG: LytTR family DNA-binding domain-containing protein [Bacteroidia bacterium]